MTLTERQIAILTGVLSDRAYYAALEPKYEHGNWQAVTERQRIEEARQGYVVCRPSAWLREEISDSVRVMLGRDYKKLQRAGLIERHNLFDGDRTTHLKLTPDGEIAAGHLLAEEGAGASTETATNA